MADDDFNENSDSSGESESETRNPENIDINIDETPIEEGVTEETEEGGEESGDFGGSDFVPSSRFSSRAVNSFLEQESIQPVTSLESDILNSSSHSAERRTIDQEQTQGRSEVQNAPQYSPSTAGYGRKSYYELPEDDTYPETIRPMQARSEISASLPFDDLPKARLLNPNDSIGWRNQDTGYPREDYKHKFEPETKKKRRDVW
ncbi:MAG: hypothetical protein PHH54_01800 [Candidatus Nanoarchaeia archaeon]|nr:hypothetical protein [Candidatus Nanoarchaeia archaeon]MDD5740696.1 hypothetical protein [Candidatus Nanoarchaeia archaeon]